jgi:hypothetical protein
LIYLYLFLDCLNTDNQNFIEEIKFFKAKVGNNHKKNLHSDPNMQFHFNQQIEEELNYYRNITKDLEGVIKKLKIKNYFTLLYLNLL